MNDEEEKKHFAVLIDADNISEKYAASIFNEIADYGYASYRRIYGNWAKGNGWKEDTLLENSINPIQQFNYTIGKNATDMAYDSRSRSKSQQDFRIFQPHFSWVK